MADTGWHEADVAATVDRGGDKKPWTDYNNAKDSDADFALSQLAAASKSDDDDSDWLRLSDFDFALAQPNVLPADAIIDGIEVKIDKHTNGVSRLVYDQELYLKYNGTIKSANYASGVRWYGGIETITYGGSTDKWGNTLTVAQIRSTLFQVDFAAYNYDVASSWACVCYIRIKIYYHLGFAHEKALFDTVTISDSIVKAIGLNKADTATIADALSKSVGLVKADTVTITDAISKAVSLVKADVVTIADSMTSHIGIGLTIVLSDLVTITDRLVGVLTTRVLLKQRIARMQVKGMDIARMGIKKMGIDKMPLYRWITRRWTA